MARAALTLFHAINASSDAWGAPLFFRYQFQTVLELVEQHFVLRPLQRPLPAMVTSTTTAPAAVNVATARSTDASTAG